MEEIWKIYHLGPRVKWEVSNIGNVKRNGELYNCYLNHGYLCFGTYYLHRAVAELFLNNKDNKPCVDHIDTNKLNNRYDNLRWVTIKENRNNPLTQQHQREVKRTEEWCKRISESKKGKHYPKISESRKGKHFPKLSESLKGKPSPMKGKTMSDDSKRKISESKKGKHFPKVSESKRGEKNPNWGRKKQRINKDGQRKYVFVEDLNNYIKNNWKLGW